MVTIWYDDRTTTTMKIGILTQPLRYNYGGILQNYALQTILRRMGHEPVTIELPNSDEKSLFARGRYFIRTVLNALSDRKGRLFCLMKWSESMVLSQNLAPFIKTHINVCKYMSEPGENEYDAYIVGSDQVWRPMYANLDHTYLMFARNWEGKKRLAYAASFGVDDWEYSNEQTQVYKELVKMFDAVSVREESGVRLCQEFFGIRATHVLDPTLLLTQEDYISGLDLNKFQCRKKGLFFYLLDENENKKNLTNKLACAGAWKAYTVNSHVENPSALLNERIQPPIEEWLHGFMDASFVVTDSFHGMVFSLIFNKPFLVIANSKRGIARFKSLLSLTGQSHRMITNTEGVELNKFIDEPNANLDVLREKSMSFLRENLS